MDTGKITMSVYEFDHKPQNCAGFWKVSSMGQVLEQEPAAPEIFPSMLSG